MAALLPGAQIPPDYCIHKLPTSCRLTATNTCCACMDERPHVASYPTYVDGTGTVSRATRWDSYCPCCKDFWTARISVSSMASRTSETRIPDHPDLLPFLKVWYDCFGGWKEVTTANGELVRVEIICEPLRNVAPGRLPRILGERTLGQDGGAVNRHNGREETLGHSTRETGTGAASTDLSHDEASLRYDQLVRIVDAKEEITSLRATVSQVWRLINQLETETVNQTEAEHASMLINSSLPSIAGLIRCQKAELTSFLTNNAANVERDARSPVAEGDATVPSRLQSQLNDAWRHLAVASESLDQEKARGTYATAIHEEAQHRLDTAQVTFLAARNHVRRLEAQKQEADNFARTFGTREEMEQQGEDYVSPIGGMFSRAWDRYRQREEVRARNLERMAEQEQLEQRRRDHRLVELLAAEDHIMADGAINNDEGIIIIEEAASDDEGDAPELEQQADGDHGEEEEEEEDDDDAEYDEYADVGSLDMADGERPAPLEDDAMNIMLACKICYTQKASIAVLPCGHCVMCQWCANLHIPTYREESTRPLQRSKCPVCRSRVKKRVKLYFS